MIEAFAGLTSCGRIAVPVGGALFVQFGEDCQLNGGLPEPPCHVDCRAVPKGWIATCACAAGLSRPVSNAATVTTAPGGNGGRSRIAMLGVLAKALSFVIPR